MKLPTKAGKDSIHGLNFPFEVKLDKKNENKSIFLYRIKGIKKGTTKFRTGRIIINHYKPRFEKKSNKSRVAY